MLQRDPGQCRSLPASPRRQLTQIHSFARLPCSFTLFTCLHRKKQSLNTEWKCFLEIARCYHAQALQAVQAIRRTRLCNRRATQVCNTKIYDAVPNTSRVKMLRSFSCAIFISTTDSTSRCRQGSRSIK